MDGRRETVYSDAAIDAHQRFISGGARAMTFLRELHPDLIWLPGLSLPVTQQLQAAGWNPIFDGAASKVWAQPPANPRIRSLDVSPEATPRCFPGP